MRLFSEKSGYELWRAVLLHITDPNVTHDLTMFDVGQGDCVLVRDTDHKSMLVDCGAQFPKRHSDVPRQIETLSIANNTCGLVISHYHEDHFSLYRQFAFPQKLFSQTYIPSLPIRGPGQLAGFALMEYLMLASFAQFGHYRIMPDLFSTFSGRVVPVRKGDEIDEGGLEFDVIWPDLTSNTFARHSIRRKAGRIRAQVRPLLERFGVLLSDDYSMEQFIDHCRELLQEERHLRQETEAVQTVLRSVENEFRDVADDFSLAMITKDHCKDSLLFLGDLPNHILSQLTVPKRDGFDCIKSSHHGTRFGKSLEGQNANYLFVSRSERERPTLKRVHDGYFKRMTCQNILTTEFLGTCHIG